MKKSLDTKKGFTLIELLVVVAIIGILAAVGVVAYSGYTSGAKNNVVKQNHKTITSAIAREVIVCDTEGKIDRFTWHLGTIKTYTNCFRAFDQGVVDEHFIFVGLKNPFVKSSRSKAVDILWDEKAVIAGTGKTIGNTFVLSNNNILSIKTYLKDGTILSNDIQY